MVAAPATTARILTFALVPDMAFVAILPSWVTATMALIAINNMSGNALTLLKRGLARTRDASCLTLFVQTETDNLELTRRRQHDLVNLLRMRMMLYLLMLTLMLYPGLTKNYLLRPQRTHS